jgi:hypothetical protein
MSRNGKEGRVIDEAADNDCGRAGAISTVVSLLRELFSLRRKDNM